MHHQLVSDYGKDVINMLNLTKWCFEFKVGRSDFMMKRVEGPSFVIDETIKNVGKIDIDRCLMIT